MVDAQFERAVFVATLGYWFDYQEAHVPVLDHVFGEAVCIGDGLLDDVTVFVN